MSAYSSQLEENARSVIKGYIDVATATKVPETSDLRLERNAGVIVQATYLYADLIGSSNLAQRAYKPVTAKIIRSYINGAANVLRHYGGEIRSFDGDRVMAIHMGDGKETRAVRAALAINWLVDQVLAPGVKAQWTDLDFWKFQHSIGIDTGEALITRGGVRGDNDLISIGSAPNVAAKLSDIRDGVSLHITKEVYDVMDNEVAFTELSPPYIGFFQKIPMWTQLPIMSVGGRNVQPFGSNYWWEP